MYIVNILKYSDTNAFLVTSSKCTVCLVDFFSYVNCEGPLKALKET